MSAILRAIFSSRSFVSDAGHSTMENIARTSTFKSLVRLSELAIDQGRSTPLDPSPFKRTLDEKLSRYRGFQQHDAHEFFMDLLCLLEQETFPMLRDLRVRELKITYRTDSKVGEGTTEDEKEWYDRFADEGDMVDFPTMRCPSRRNFGGVLLTTRTCCSCGYSTSKREAFKCIPLDLHNSGTKSVKQLIDFFFTAEPVDARCENCPNKDSLLQRRLLRLPRVLVVQLKRFGEVDAGVRKRNMADVSIDKGLDLTRYCVTDRDLFQKAIPVDEDEVNAYYSKRHKSTQNAQNIATVFGASDDISWTQSAHKRRKIYEGNADAEFFLPPGAAPSGTQSVDTFEEEMQRALNDSRSSFAYAKSDEEFDLQLREAIRQSEASETANARSKEKSAVKCHDIFEDDELRQSQKLKSDRAAESTSFKLLCIVNHEAAMSKGHYVTSGGHYVTDVYNAETKIWHHHDDSRVDTYDDANNVFMRDKSASAYMLFYENAPPGKSRHLEGSHTSHPGEVD
jgi:ubiquitin C-terminal hydrolase